MKKLALVALCLSVSAALAQNQPVKTNLKVGDEAPDFTVSARSSSSGKEVKLSDFRGKKNVILAFFPAAFSGG